MFEEYAVAMIHKWWQEKEAYKEQEKNKYRKNKYDRKPNPGMIIKAIKKWNIDISSSFFIGDKETDKIAAQKAKIEFYFKNNKSLYKQIKSILK